jgi:DNA-binding LytR/AlgR family response regulator
MMRAIIIDDEPNAIELLSGYVERIPFVECAATFRNPLEALDYLRLNQVDLIFLDINMPQLSGIAFLETLTVRPKVVLTTAYAEYAVKSYEFSVDDYLLKPISFERFLKAVNRIQQSESPKVQSQIINEHIFLKSGYQSVKVLIADIHYLEKDGNYMIYYTEGKKIMVRENIKQALDKLSDHFFQVHKSFIVPLSGIDAIESGRLKIGNNWVPIGASFKKGLTERLNDMGQ